MKVCPTYGPGFFYIPGTQTCLKIGGTAAFYAYGSTVYRQATDGLNTNAQLTVTVDARDSTEYGVVRAYMLYNFGRSSGSDDNSGSWPRRGLNGQNATGGYAALQTNTNMNAYVQIGGFTAGRLASFAAANNPDILATQVAGSSGPVNQFAYTASLGNGISVTGAVEDAAELREGLGGFTAASPNRVPDGVLSFDVAQSWGTAKLAGVYHNVAPAGRETDASSKMGYALVGGLKINLPMIAAGDFINFHGAWGEGAAGRVIGAQATDTVGSSFAAAGTGTLSPSPQTSGAGSFGVGRVNTSLLDGVYANGALTLTKSYSFGAEFKHYFTPTVAGYVGGNIGKMDYPSTVQNTTTYKDGTMYLLTAGVVWSPITGLTINPEVAYYNLKVSAAMDSTVAAMDGRALKSDSKVIGRLRVARSF